VHPSACFIELISVNFDVEYSHIKQKGEFILGSYCSCITFIFHEDTVEVHKISKKTKKYEYMA
jgi:hypothetical protein